MARQGSSAAIPAAAVGAVAFIAAERAFVSLGAARAPTAPGSSANVAAAAPTSYSAATAATGIAAAAFSMGAAAAARSLAGSRSLRPAVARRAETPFAGGLIGGESAFSSFDYNFDPLGIAEKCPQYLPWFREAELKHGRICMLAWVGLVVPEVLRIPGPDGCYSATVVDAHNACVGDASNGQLFQVGPMFQIFAFCGLIEMLTTFPKAYQGITLENAGDYRLGLNYLPTDPDKAKEMKLKELKNGRLAMLAFGGAITQAVLSGNGFPWLYANGESKSGSVLASSIRAASNSTMVRGSKIAMGSYKMSKSVPFLPASPALEGYPGEEDGFDPMGFSLAIDIRWLREAELKHGRVCMLATVGWIATDLGMRVPGEAFQVSTLDAHDAMVKFGSMPQMLCWLGYAELFGFLAIINMMEGKTDRKPGDFGIRLLYPKDEQGQYDMQMKELRNGRLAMLAYGGIVTAAVLTQKTWPFFATGERSVPAFGAGSALCGGLQGPQAARSAVSVCALETSRSLPFLPKPQNLKGYAGEEAEFDPLGFSDTFDIRWLREAELKHGRVCMLATVGFVAQQYITLPGMTPTADSMQAVYTASPAGMATLLFAVGWIESSSYGGKITMLDMFEDDREPGNLNFGTRFLAGKTDAENNDTRLKELNNGRLAMLAFSGMVHHNLVVKGPLFPLFPDGWQGPQYTWKLDSVMSGIQ